MDDQAGEAFLSVVDQIVGIGRIGDVAAVAGNGRGPRGAIRLPTAGQLGDARDTIAGARLRPIKHFEAGVQAVGFGVAAGDDVRTAVAVDIADDEAIVAADAMIQRDGHRVEVAGVVAQKDRKTVKPITTADMDIEIAVTVQVGSARVGRKAGRFVVAPNTRPVRCRSIGGHRQPCSP